MALHALAIHWRAQRRAPTALGLLLAAVALLCMAWVAGDYADADAEWQTLQTRQARQSRATQAAQRGGGSGSSTGSARTPAGPLPREDALSAAQIDAQLQRPWDALLHALEQPAQKNVALMGVDVQAAAHSVHLVGEARTMADALAYVQQLRQSGVLQSIYLSTQEEKQSGAQKVQRFSLDARWSEAP